MRDRDPASDTPGEAEPQPAQRPCLAPGLVRVQTEPEAHQVEHPVLVPVEPPPEREPRRRPVRVPVELLGLVRLPFG